MPKKAAFLGKTLEKTNEPIKLIHIISIDQEHQVHADFKLFIQLVNKHKHKINHLVILDTSYLHRHYNTQYADLKTESPWLSAHKSYFSLLDKTIKCEVMSWHTITQDSQYARTYAAILQDYKGEPIDPKFYQVVQNVAFKHKHKGTEKNASDYILEECTGVLLLDESYVTYPGRFNAAISYVIEKYKKGPKLIPYRFRGSDAQEEQPSSVASMTEKPSVPIESGLLMTSLLREEKLIGKPVSTLDPSYKKKPKLDSSGESKAYDSKMSPASFMPSQFQSGSSMPTGDSSSLLNSRSVPLTPLVVKRAKKTWKEVVQSSENHKPGIASLLVEMLFIIVNAEITIEIENNHPLKSDALKPATKLGPPARSRLPRSASEGHLEYHTSRLSREL